MLNRDQEEIEACPKCGTHDQVRKKTILIGRASPAALFAEERAGYLRRDQLAVDECDPEKIANAPLQQFLDGYYCAACDLGFVPDIRPMPRISTMTFSAPTPIRAVVFDFGGVLFDWSPHYLYEQLIADEQERNHFLTHICSPEWNVQQDGGRTLAEATAHLVEQHPEHDALIRAFYDRWTEMLRGPLPEGVALLRELHAQQVPVFGLTNWSAETYPHARDHHDFMQLFRDIVVSGHERCIKPEPRIYQIALERYARHLPGLKPEELVFIDDVQKNIDGCRALGWQGIHHVDADKTRAQLRALGLPV